MLIGCESPHFVVTRSARSKTGPLPSEADSRSGKSFDDCAPHPVGNKCPRSRAEARKPTVLRSTRADALSS